MYDSQTFYRMAMLREVRNKVINCRAVFLKVGDDVPSGVLELCRGGWKLQA